MYRIITNNQMCLVKYGDQIQVEYLDGQSYMAKESSAST